MGSKQKQEPEQVLYVVWAVYGYMNGNNTLLTHFHYTQRKEAEYYASYQQSGYVLKDRLPYQPNKVAYQAA